MSTEHNTNEEAIYYEAIGKEPAEREAYLQAACGQDAALLARIRKLLKAREVRDSFLESAPWDAVVTSDASAVTEGPGTVIGRYKLLEKIGEGGMAVVYMAEQTEPIRRKVALKIIKLGMDTRQVIARFEAERQALALMDHPSIAKVLDAGATETGRPYFVMELVTGVSITEYCDKNNLSTKDRLALFVQVCNAVQHAHQKGIIHRDIKPSNVMVTHHDSKPVPKVIDFGIAKATNQRLTEKTLFTRYAHIIGTPAYMSPEQAELSDLDIDTRSDIYSLGVLLYELLTGTTPFSEEELRKAGYVEMQRIIREQEPAKPSTRIRTSQVGQLPWRGRPALVWRGHPARDSDPGRARHKEQGQDALATGRCTPYQQVRGDLDWIVMKSLEKDRARRYDTASALAEDVRRHLDHEPVLARSPATTYRLRKFLRRHRSQVVAGLAIAAVAGAVAVVLSLWNRDRVQLVEAEGLRHRAVLSQAREQYAKADRDAALETIKPILASRHVGPEARLLQAAILVDNRRSEEAVTVLNKLLNEQPAIAGAAHSFLARILWESQALDAGKLQEIETHRRQAEALLPKTADAYFLRAMTAPTVKEQLAVLDRALELDWRHYESRRLRVFTYYVSRKYDRMSEDALFMEALHDRDPLGHSLRAHALRHLGRYEEALAEYDRALALTPTDSPQYVDWATQRSEVLLYQGDYERVIENAPKVLELAPDCRVFRYHLFVALTARGDYGRAVSVFQQMGDAGQDARQQFPNWCAKYVFDALGAGRAWHPADREPVEPALLPLIEAEETYRKLSTRGHCVITDGFSAQWSPDGKKVVFCPGVEGNSGVAVFDLATSRTDLLIVPGKYPKWSPDGRYIAFARDREFLRMPEVISHDPQNRPSIGADEEIWFMKSDGTEPRRLARGVWPYWARDSSSVYYRSRADNTLYSISIVGKNASPKRIMVCPGYFPSLSPDNERVAYLEGGSLKVKDLTSQTLVAQWPLPRPSTDGWGAPAWSPTGKELCLGGRGGLEDGMGLWIYRLDQSEPAHVLDGPITVASWAADGTKLVLELGEPHFEIWTMDLTLNVSTVEALGPAQTPEEHFRETLALYTRRIEANPQDAPAYASRAAYHDHFHERTQADADMKRWSAVVSGKSPLDLAPASADLTFGEPVELDSTMPFLKDAYIDCFSFDGLEMFIGSWRPGGYGEGDIWVVKHASLDDDWGAPENLGPAVNSAGNDAVSSITADGLELYFNSNRSEGYGNYDLYVTRRATRDSPWGHAVKLGPPVNSSNLEAFPRVSADGLELYFMSVRPGGYGAFDLYVSRRTAASDPWGDPANLGPTVNTPYCETGHCLSADGLQLFFQDFRMPRPGGYGGGDIWMTRRASRSDPWGPPVNLGPKINGPDFDHRPCLAPDGSALYFARQSGGVLTHWKAWIIPAGDSDVNGKAKGKEDQR